MRVLRLLERYLLVGDAGTSAAEDLPEDGYDA